jgi:flagellar biogenesis protein FliO
VLRSILDTVPLTLLLIAALGFSVAVVLLAVWLIRRIVPATREGFHAEISCLASWSTGPR